ncbi:MAG: sugar ABC transporter substrate-binding protein [Anaerolineae bacterium]
MQSQNKFSRRSFLKAAAAGGASLAFANLLPALARAQAAGDINYWHHFTSEQEFQGLEAVMALFAEKYPDIKLTQENIPNADFMAKYTAAVAANSLPSTTMVAAERFPDMNGMESLVDLTDKINNWDLKKDFPENSWDGITADDKIYGVPAFSFIDWMYYRVDYFQEAGIDKSPTTFEEFQDAAIKLTDPAKNRYGFGLRGGGGGQGYIIGMIEAFGSPIVVDGKAAIDKAKAIEAIKFWSELFTVHKVVPPSAPSDSFSGIMEAFKVGQTAMVFHHTGSLTDLSTTLGDKVMTAVLPKGPANTISFLSYQYNGVSNADNLEAAWDWVSFWGEADPALAFLEKTGYFPASSIIADDPRVTGNKLYTAAFDSLKIGRVRETFVGYAEWSQNVVLPAYQKVLVGDATVEQAVDEMIVGLEKAL